MNFGILLFFIFGIFNFPEINSFAATQGDFTIVIKNHQFSPATLKIPIHKRVKIAVDNQDPTAEEFESYDLNREKVVNGHKSIIVFLGPLSKGTYKYFGDFHQSTAQGIIVAQ